MECIFSRDLEKRDFKNLTKLAAPSELLRQKTDHREKVFVETSNFPKWVVKQIFQVRANPVVNSMSDNSIDNVNESKYHQLLLTYQDNQGTQLTRSSTV